MFGLSLIFLAVVLIGFSSAAVSLSLSSLNIYEDNSSFTFDINGAASQVVNLSIDPIINKYNVDSNITFTYPSQVTLDASGSMSVSVSLVKNNFDFKYNDYTTKVKIVDETDSTDKDEFLLRLNSGEKDYETNILEIVDLDFSIVDGIGDDDDGFYPFDTMRVDFTVENNGNYRVKGIKLNICVYDKSKRRCIFNEKDFELSDNNFDLDDDDYLDVRGTLFLDIGSLRSGNTDYSLLVTATGKIKASGSEMNGKNTYGRYSYNLASDLEFDIITDDEFVVVSNVETLSSTVNCGQKAIISGELWNVGDDSLSNNRVYLNIWSKELDFDEVIGFNDDLDSFKYFDFQYEIDVPKGLVEGREYLVQLDVYKNEKISDKYLYKNGQGMTSKYKYYLKIDGGCAIIKPTISARLIGDAVVGKESSISVTVVNGDSITNKYRVSVEGYDDSIANLISMSSSEITLTSGGSTVVNVRFEPLLEGVLDFTLKLVDEDGNIFTQPVSLKIEKPGLKLNFDNELFLYVLAGVLGFFVLLLFVLVIINAKKQKKVSRHD